MEVQGLFDYGDNVNYNSDGDKYQIWVEQCPLKWKYITVSAREVLNILLFSLVAARKSMIYIQTLKNKQLSTYHVNIHLYCCYLGTVLLTYV